jgi:hypothetical protein
MKETKHEHEHKGHEHHVHEAHEMADDFDIEKDFNKLALEEVVYGNQHVLNILLDILIEKGLISEQEFKDKLEEMIAASQEMDEASGVNVELPDDEDK